MDDLSSLQWSAPRAPFTGQQRPQASGGYYPVLQATLSVSGQSTPSALPLEQKPPGDAAAHSGSSTPANDSFANLVSFGSSQPNKKLSLQEQQRLRELERQKEEAKKRQQFDSNFGGMQAATWDSLGDGRAMPSKITSAPTYTATEGYGVQKSSKVINKPFSGIPTASAPTTPRTQIDEENDLLATFNAEAPVDKSSHMPPASKISSLESLTSSNGAASRSNSSLKGLNGSNGDYSKDLDDDPFGLDEHGYPKHVQQATMSSGANGDDDDVLGLLSRPIAEFPTQPKSKPRAPEPPSESQSRPQDQAVAELVDMGFAPGKAKRALETTDSGTDVQAAVGWLFNQTHGDARKETRRHSREEDRNGASGTQQSRRTPGRRKSSTSGTSKPAWMRELVRPSVNQQRPDIRAPVNGEKYPAQYASEIGTKVFKTANSLWKTGTKKLNQAVSDFNSDSDSNQPKWMRDAPPDAAARKPRSQSREHGGNDHNSIDGVNRQHPVPRAFETNVTDEALMLEADSRPPPRKSRPNSDAPRQNYDSSRDQSPAFPPRLREQSTPQSKLMQHNPSRDPRAKLSGQAVEEEAAQAYISPARRKKVNPTAAPSASESEPELLFADSRPSSRPRPSAAHPKSTSQPLTPPIASVTTRSPPYKRTVPSLSSFALQASTQSRKAGTGAFKRGDYAEATTHYSTSLSALPSTHPLTIILLTNRALSHSKTGDPKASIADARSALDLIGPSRGAAETIDLGSGEGVKPMSTYWEKAMMRQAEALEHLERWSEAAAVWRSCVEVGVGGATSIAGRNRCEKAAAPFSQAKPSTTTKQPAVNPKPKPSALGDFAPDSESVTRLRAANAAADRLDDEKFALAEIVDSRVSKWRAGKEGNLRALLSTLENVLWGNSGWRKVGMGDILLPEKVKLVYMKGIAKVHPDKLPPTATTEEKMISAAVFATLNEAWERFKTENGL